MSAEARRSTDREGLARYTCWLAERAQEFWDFIDKRDIDKHLVSLAVFMGTIKITEWAMAYADHHADKSGLEVAAVMGAILAPYMALQAAAISFYFRARQ